MREWLKQCLGDALHIGAVVLAVAIPTVLMLTHVWYQFRITRLGYKISEQTERHEKLADQHRKLEIEATVEGRGERLTEVAKRRFGLERVEPEQVITVEPAPDRTARRGGSGAEREGGPSTEPSLDQTEHASLEQEPTE